MGFSFPEWSYFGAWCLVCPLSVRVTWCVASHNLLLPIEAEGIIGRRYKKWGTFLEISARDSETEMKLFSINTTMVNFA